MSYLILGGNLVTRRNKRNPLRRASNFPSIKTLTSRLALSRYDAEALRGLHAAGRSPRKVLEIAGDMMGHEVESIQTIDDTPGLLYVNVSDPYVDTLIYDRSRETWRVGGWGDIVERQPRRFGVDG